MIESITIKNIASFDNTGVIINDLKKVNYFFGFNGTGKSTIVNYLQNISLPNNEQSGKYSSCFQKGYEPSQYQLVIFNNNFIEQNFIRNSTLKGVFSLNQTNATIDAQIDKENIIIKNFKDRIIVIKKRKQDIENYNEKELKKLKDFCWLQRDKFSTFPKIGKLDHSGSRDEHFKKINNIIQELDNTNSTTIEQLTEQYLQLYEKDITKIEISIDVSCYKKIRDIEKELNPFLQEIIIGNEDVDIAELIKSLDIRSWVEQGTQIIEKSNNICPFCQKPTIDDSLKEQFSKYFDETYKQKIVKIQYLLSQYQKYTEQLLISIMEIQKTFNPKNILSDEYQALKNIFDDNIQIIRHKIKYSNEKKNIISLNTRKTNLSYIIKIIKENNIIFDDLNNRKILFIKNIWLYMSFQSKNAIDLYEQKEIKCIKILEISDKLINEVNKKIEISNKNIEVLRTQTKNTKEAVDNINNILKYAYFEGFEIKEKGNNENNICEYYLKRNNIDNDEPIFNTLSEGEKNFISFLYFYQLCIGTDDINNSIKKKIIIIDDPVSSLDSQALFIVTSIIHNLISYKENDKRAFKTENIEQVLIFTHNLYFYKEISLKYKPICKEISYYQIIKNNTKSTVNKMKYDDIYFDDYTLLWKTLKNIKEIFQQDKSLNILISNSMRRIIESYINFISLGNDVWASIINEKPEEPNYYIKCAFLSMINDESHKIPFDNNIYFQKIIYEEPKILFDVFEMIFNVIGKEHYDSMMK